MPESHTSDFRRNDIAQTLIKEIRVKSKKQIRLMEVCGTHTMSVFKHGVRSVLPETITLLSGPGCPVCVTSQSEIDAFIKLADEKDVIITTFGDLLRVPGSNASLHHKKAEGADIRIVYSSMDALDIAKKKPQKTIVFPGIGFETTAPGTAATILAAEKAGIKNFCVLSAQKTVPPALFGLMNIPGVQVDGFLLPGHVSVIIGEDAYRPFVESSGLPCVIAGFEPVDILAGILQLVTKIESGDSGLVNAYKRAVLPEGNPKAREILYSVFEPADARWRGIGNIPESGLVFKETFKAFDPLTRFSLSIPESEEIKGCACGEILTGLKIPPECALFRKKCTPINPIGPCMVSTEGTCAAYYKYQ